MRKHTLEAILQRLLRHAQIHNVVLAVQSAESGVQWRGAGGAAHADGTPMQTDTPYFVASVTKMFTAAVIMHLHHSGRLPLDDRISRYLPAALIADIHVYRGTDYTGQLTVEDLLTQRSGLADYYEERVPGRGNVLTRLLTEGDYAWNAADVTELVRTHLKPHFRPGEGKRAFYSDTNYTLLGEIIETVTQKSLATVYDETIAQPLELCHTYLFSAAQERSPKPASIYFGQQELCIPKALSSVGAQGGIVSTAVDQIAFLQGFFTGRLFPAHYLPRMQTWRRIFFPLQYGHGLMRFHLPWFLAPFQDAPEFIGHSGSTGSFLFHAPARGLYIAGTVNQIRQYRKPFQVLLQVSRALG